MKFHPVPFTLHIPDTAIDDLRRRLSHTRLPDQAPGEPWAYGTDVDYLRGLLDYWQTGFDWRAEEAALNAFPQYYLNLPDVELHYLHVPGVGPNPMPLLLLHGWPGSVFEFLDMIPRLTDPARFGGDPRDAVTVIAPSLPGYALSFRPGQKRFSIAEMTDRIVSLMETLGYARFGAQGGDWGAGVATRLGYAYADKMTGVHVNLLMGMPRDPAAVPNPSVEEQRYFSALAVRMREDSGYQWIQGTRPQTLAYGLNDSPAGLAGWMVEKFHAWSDCGGNVERAVGRDRMLGNIALYWFTAAIGSSFWPYYASRHEPPLIPLGATVDVPAGYAEFPCEVMKPPRSMAERVFTDLRHWNVMPRGGHFAALEQPSLLAEDVQAFFRGLR